MVMIYYMISPVYKIFPLYVGQLNFIYWKYYRYEKENVSLQVRLPVVELKQFYIRTYGVEKWRMDGASPACAGNWGRAEKNRGKDAERRGFFLIKERGWKKERVFITMQKERMRLIKEREVLLSRRARQREVNKERERFFFLRERRERRFLLNERERDVFFSMRERETFSS